MALRVIAISLFALFLVEASPALADDPRVAVLEFYVDGGIDREDASSLAKTARNQIRKETLGYVVLDAKEMYRLHVKHEAEISSCKEDCDLKVGKLFDVDYVVSGEIKRYPLVFKLSFSLRKVETGETISSQEARSKKFHKLGRGMKKAVSALAAALPKNRDIEPGKITPEDLLAPSKPASRKGKKRRAGKGVVMQMRDDEATPSRKEVTAERSVALSSYDDANEDEENDGWDREANDQPMFGDGHVGSFDTGFRLGLSILFGRGSDVDSAYSTILRLGVEAGYNLFPIVEIALVVDIEILSGESLRGESATEELRPEREPTGRTRRRIDAIINNMWSSGLRPTVRLNFPFKSVDAYLGAGAGPHYYSTSGEWQTTTSDNAYSAIYSFDESNLGLYAVIEAAALYRFLDRRFGAGGFVMYTAPFHNGVMPNVTIKQDYDRDLEDSADKDDYADTFIRQLASMGLLTIGVVAEARF